MGRRKDFAKVDFADREHPSDDMLERYAMGRSPESEMAAFEEHLLICESCQDRLALQDNIRQRVRDGASLPQPPDAVWWSFLKLAWAAGLVAFGLAIFAGYQWQFARHSAGAPAVILLQTTRGGEDPAATAPANRPFTLALDLTGLQQFSKYRLEVVRSAGSPVFQAIGAPQGNRLLAAFSRGLADGAYFVRVYTPTGELLREYALLIRG